MSLTISGYMRQLYKGNAYGATATGREGQPAHSLFSADLKAIRRAVKELGEYDYDDGEGSELMDKVQAFVNTYNNYLDSAKGMDNEDVSRYLNKMKKLTKEHADELGEIGISIKSNGQLKIDKKKLQDTGRYQVSVLFSENAEYAQMTEKQMKQTERMYLRNNLNIPKQSTDKKESGDSAQTTLQVQSAQQMVNSFVGNHIDCML